MIAVLNHEDGEFDLFETREQATEHIQEQVWSKYFDIENFSIVEGKRLECKLVEKVKVEERVIIYDPFKNRSLPEAPEL